MEHMLKTLADVSEVVFDQPEEKAGEMEPDGSVLNRHKEEEWLEDTEPYHGARPRTTKFDRPVDEVLGATSGGKEENVKLRDSVVPRLHPEQQIRQEEEVQTPPRREPRRNEGHQPRGPRAMTDESVLGPGGLADQQKDTTGRNRQNDEWSPVAALEDTVSRMQRYLEDLQTENRFLRTPRAPVPVPLVRQAALTTTKVPLIMDRRVDWQTTAESLIRQYGNQGRTLPTLLLLWRRWLLKHLEIWARQRV